MHAPGARHDCQVCICSIPVCERTLFSATIWNGDQDYKIRSFDLHNQPFSCMFEISEVSIPVSNWWVAVGPPHILSNSSQYNIELYDHANFSVLNQLLPWIYPWWLSIYLLPVHISIPCSCKWHSATVMPHHQSIWSCFLGCSVWFLPLRDILFVCFLPLPDILF